ncbi:MAG: type I phosphomannose isomerase catalytic subunit [Eubacterium sp.]
MDVLMLKPVFKDAIWGGTLLQDFGYGEAGDRAGECWGISAHQNGDCIVESGEFAGKTLSWCWDNHRELFGNMKGDVFPLLVKILGAEDDLSIQVHPNDEYAAVHENGALGKTECWYILDCKEDATIVIGHNAKNKQELADMIHQEKWNELIRVIPIKKGDFFQIDPGCLHAIKGGTLLIETQQSSDVTYRVYDYDRLQNGKPRELHVQQSIDCITAPHKDYDGKRIVNNYPGMTSEMLVKCPFYTLEKWEVEGDYLFEMDKAFMNASVIEGCGSVNGRRLTKGNHFIVPSGIGECNFQGKMTIMVSYCD